MRLIFCVLTASLAAACAAGPDPAFSDAETVQADEVTLSEVTRRVKALAPEDPQACRRRASGEPQSVRVRLDVLPNGRPANVEVISSTDACYDRYARSAALKWRYAPPVLDGRPVRVEGVTAKVRFGGGGGRKLF